MKKLIALCAAGLLIGTGIMWSLPAASMVAGHGDGPILDMQVAGHGDGPIIGG